MNGDRFNTGKPKWSLIDFNSLEGVTYVLEFGVKKYGLNNWKKGLKTIDCCESALRHIFKFINNEDLDSESGLHHVDHAITNLMMVKYMLNNKKEFDNRKEDETR